MTLEVTSFTSSIALATGVAQELLSLLCRVQAEGRVPQVVLTGGTIADLVHTVVAELAEDTESWPVDWSTVEFWWGDERFVAADSPDRNAGQAHRAWLDKVPVDPARIHEMPPMGTDSLDGATTAYASTMAAVLGDRAFDVVMLGIGPDAHVASLFPGHATLEATGAVVAERNSPKPPPERISLTFSRLLHAEQVWVLAAGLSKQDAVGALLAPTGSVSHTPARALLPHPALTLWTDLPGLRPHPR